MSVVFRCYNSACDLGLRDCIKESQEISWLGAVTFVCSEDNTTKYSGLNALDRLQLLCPAVCNCWGGFCAPTVQFISRSHCLGHCSFQKQRSLVMLCGKKIF